MLSKLLKIIIVLIYSPLAMECLLRILAPVPMLPRYVEASPYGIRTNVPNKRYHHSTAEYKILIQTNSKGIRANREIPYTKPISKKRILLLGDSFGMGYGVNIDEMFTERMSFYLKFNYGLDVEVVNLSSSGYGNDEELIILLNEGFKYDPDLVLLSWQFTDLEDNVRSNLFQLIDQKIVRKSKSYLPGIKERQFLNQFAIYRFLAEHSQIYNFFRNWAGTNVKKWLVASRFKNSSNKQNQMIDEKKLKENYEKKLTIALLTEIEHQCKVHNCHFLLLDIPYKVSREEFVSKFPYQYMSKDNLFQIVSPISKFKTKKGEQIYWEKGDIHFTPLGCDLVGEVLSEYIYQHNLLKPVD